MAQDIDLGDDDGFVTVRVGGDERRIDLFEASGKLASHYQRFKDSPDEEYGAGLLAVLAGLGLPPCSQKMARRLADEVFRRVGELTKKNGGPAGSPGSTGSTPGA